MDRCSIKGGTKGSEDTFVGEDFLAFFDVVRRAVMLGPVVSLVCRSGAPEESELVLRLAAP